MAFPVKETSNIKSYDDIVSLRENVPYSGTATYSGALSVSQTLINFYPDASGSFPIGINRMAYVKYVDIYCDKDIVISFRTENTISNIFAGPNDSIIPNGHGRINVPIHLKAGIRFTLPMNIFRLPYNTSMAIINLQGADATIYNLRLNVFGYSITKNYNLSAPHSWLAVGDSITNGTGASPVESVGFDASTEHFLSNIKRYLKNVKGYDFWLTNKAVSSMTSSGLIQQLNWGFLDIDKIDLMTCMIGANDANNLGTVGNYGLHLMPNQTIFQNNIDYFLTWFTKNYPNGKLIMWGSTPSADNTTEARTEIGRAIISARVTALNNDNVRYCSLATAFDRTNSTNYLPADTIHPVAQSSISTAMKTFIDSLGWYV